MKTTLFTQPFDSEDISQQFGLVLIDLINSSDPFYDQIWIVSAFANQRAVDQLTPHLKTAISRGALVRINVGIDHQSTSIEALQSILQLNLEAKVVHSNQPGHTFHPKIYLFEATDSRAELFIGSHNLTEGGLFTNYEASTHSLFELPADKEEYANFKHGLERFLYPPSIIVHPLTKELIENLIIRGEIVSEQEKREITRKTSASKIGTPDQIIPKSFFGHEAIPRSPAKPRSETETTFPIPTEVIAGDLIWEKDGLPLTDVQRQIGNPTGGLRLTQAEWRVNGQPIDQTSYFRNELFGQFEWSVGTRKPKKQETTVVPFNIHILGKAYGVYDLTISHKPSGEANQRNYTTMLHWGELADTIKSLNLGGRTFRLYAPVEGNEVFTIEII